MLVERLPRNRHSGLDEVANKLYLRLKCHCRIMNFMILQIVGTLINVYFGGIKMYIIT